MNSLLTATIVGTLVFMLLLALRPITNRVFTKAWHYYLCLVPVFFMLGGAELASWLMGFQNLGLQIGALPVINQPEVLFAPVEISFYTGAAAQGITTPAMYMPDAGVFCAKTGLAAPAIADIFLAIAPVFMAVWLLGMVVYAAVNLGQYFSFRSKLLRDSTASSVYSSVPVVISAHAPTPMLIGFFKPMIVLPDIQLSRCKLEMILAHELTHHRRKDVWVKLLVLIACAVHWFNPAAHLIKRHVHNLCEASCDEHVVMGMNLQERKLYGETILTMLQYSNLKGKLVCASGLCNSQKNIKRRLTDMLATKKTRKFRLAASLLAALMIISVGVVAAYGLRAEAYEPEEENYTYEEYAAERYVEEYTMAPEEYPGELYTEELAGVITDQVLTGSFTATNDATLATGAVINGNILIETGSNMLITDDSMVNGIINVSPGASLTLSGDTRITGTINLSGRLYMYDNALITGAGSRGVFVHPSGVFRMYGGIIYGNSYAGNGAGVFVAENGYFHLVYGLISGNKTGGYGGGGVFVDSNGYVQIVYGLVIGNYAGVEGLD